jgi:MFS transporter, DHA2 family, multidrug resistance protein
MSKEQAYEMRWKTLGVVGLGLILIGLDNTVLNVALPSIQRDLGSSGSALQWMVDAYLLVFAGLLLIAGNFGDRHGRKTALQAGLAIFAAASLAAIFATSEAGIIAARAVMGLGAALVMPATLSIVTEVFPREERGKAIGVWAGMAALGTGLGPAIGGALLEVADWQAVFAINVPVALGALLLGIRLVPDSRDPSPGRLDLLGATLSAAALSVLVYTIIEAPGHGWTDPMTLGGFALALAIALGFAVHERRAENPLLDLGLFRLPNFSVASLAISAAFFGLFGMIFALTQYLQFVQGADPLDAGLKQMPVALGLVISGPLSNVVAVRLGARRVLASGMVAVAVAFLAMLIWGPGTGTLTVCLFAFAVAFAMGFVMGPATESVMNAVPEDRAGVGSAMNDVNRMVAGALGVAVMGSIISTVYGSRMADATGGLPPEAAAAASDSIGGAAAVAAQLPEGAAQALDRAAGLAFTDAMGLAVLVGSLVLLAAAGIVARHMPGGRSRAARTVETTAPAGVAQTA